MKGKKIWKTIVIIVYKEQQRQSFEWMNDTEHIINIKELTCWK